MDVSLNESQVGIILTCLKLRLHSDCEQHFRFGHERKADIDRLVSAIQVFEPDFSLTNWALLGASLGGTKKDSCYDDNEIRDPDYYNRVRGV